MFPYRLIIIYRCFVSNSFFDVVSTSCEKVPNEYPLLNSNNVNCSTTARSTMPTTTVCLFSCQTYVEYPIPSLGSRTDITLKNYTSNPVEYHVKSLGWASNAENLIRPFRCILRTCLSSNEIY